MVEGVHLLPDWTEEKLYIVTYNLINFLLPNEKEKSVEFSSKKEKLLSLAPDFSFATLEGGVLRRACIDY